MGHIKVEMVGAQPYNLKVRDLNTNQIGFVTPWEFDPISQELNDEAAISPKSRMGKDLKVLCISPGKFQVDISTTRYNYKLEKSYESI
jgi:hypothetical protein